MFIDARTVSNDAVVETDVCIIGAGAAGLTLARELSAQPFRVCLIESGGFELDTRTQALHQGANLGLPYPPLEQTRLRYFGGSTNHWHGWCRPLGAIDFETRDWIPHSGWPFGRAHLDPFYRRAQSICELGPFAYDAETWSTASAPSFSFADGRVVTKYYQFSPPTRFGQIYRKDIGGAGNISAYLRANVIEIQTTDTAQRVIGLRLGCLTGNQFRVTAKLFILATGGIENPRLLLASNGVSRGGLGNDHDLVGRFFMEHVHVQASQWLPARPALVLEAFRRHRVNGVDVQAALTLSPETLRAKRLASFGATVLTMPVPKTSAAPFPNASVPTATGEAPVPELIAHIGNVMQAADDRPGAGGEARPTPGGIERLYYLASRSEQVPNPRSRVTLTGERDALGVPIAALDWQLTEIDRRTVRTALEIIAAEIGKEGLGRVQVTFDDQTTPILGGSHHMGTTRMHDDPKHGVVDANCRVHGIANLFIAGSSVFPTVGSANPTLTIVALALRLADHVKGLMR